MVGDSQSNPYCGSERLSVVANTHSNLIIIDSNAAKDRSIESRYCLICAMPAGEGGLKAIWLKQAQTNMSGESVNQNP